MFISSWIFFSKAHSSTKISEKELLDYQITLIKTNGFSFSKSKITSVINSTFRFEDVETFPTWSCERVEIPWNKHEWGRRLFHGFPFDKKQISLPGPHTINRWRKWWTNWKIIINRQSRKPKMASHDTIFTCFYHFCAIW